MSILVPMQSDSNHILSVRKSESGDYPFFETEWKELIAGESSYDLMRTCDIVGRMLYETYSKKWIKNGKDSVQHAQQVKNLMYVLRKGLDCVFNLRLFRYDAIDNMQEYYITLSDLSLHYGLTLLESNRLFQAYHQFKLSIQYLFKSRNTLLDDYCDTERIVQTFPNDVREQHTSDELHMMAFEKKCNIIMADTIKNLCEIEKRIRYVLSSATDIVPDDCRSLYNHVLKMQTEYVSDLSNASKLDTKEMLELMSNERFSMDVSSFDEDMREYADLNYRRVCIPPSQWSTDGEKYRDWVYRNDFFLTCVDPIMRFGPRECYLDEIRFFPIGNDSLDRAMYDVSSTFNYCRYSLYSYESNYDRITRETVGDEDEVQGFFERVKGTYAPKSIRLTGDVNAGIAASLCRIPPRFNREEKLIDCFIRLYSILDKCSNIIQDKFKIDFAYTNYGGGLSNPPASGNVLTNHLIHNQSKNPYLQSMVDIFFEVNPSKNRDLWYDSLPFAPSMYEVRNHIMHSGLHLTSDICRERQEEGKVVHLFDQELREYVWTMLYTVKEYIVGMFSAWEYENKKVEKHIRNEGKRD